MIRRSLLLIAATTLLCTIPAMASSPSLGSITPRGIQRGASHILSFNGGRLADAKEIFFYDAKWFKVTKLVPSNGNVKVHLTVSKDCRLGEHVAQVRTGSGISEYRTFWVGPYKSFPEKEPNSDFNKPQPVKLNSTITGVVTSEDVDHYVVTAKKGQRVSAEIEGMRLGTTLFDPYVAILDAKRFELASADDSPLVRQDAVCSIVAPADGKYIIQVRESAYGGNGSCRYRLHIGSFPRPTAVYPAGGKAGSKTVVRFLGDPGNIKPATINVPAQITDDYGIVAQDAGGIAPSPNPFRISPHGNALEKEPNDTVKTASPAQLPLAFNGIIEKKKDIDYFRFKAKKGQLYDIECYARRIRSALDPVMHLYYANGKQITGDDDSRRPDSYFRWRVPADGEYLIRVTDHLGRGGKDFVYRIEFQPTKPKLGLRIPRVARYSQYRQQIYVARGNRFATLISASRSNFGGPIKLDGNNLPKGLKMICEEMPGNLSVMPVVFEAAKDAPLSGRLVDFTGRHADPKNKISGGFSNRADYVISGPGQSLYVWKDVYKLPIAVVEELPFRLEIAEPKVPLVRNGSMQLKIIVHRKKGYDAPVSVQLPFRPPGVGAASSIGIGKGKTVGYYPLSASGGAQIKKWRIYALGSANVNGTAWVSSQLATLEVAAPPVTFAMQRASCEQGQETQIYCKVNQAWEFPGTAKVELLGLPAKVSTKLMSITKGTKELVFPVKTDKTSPTGKHRNVFCRVTVTKNGEPIVMRAGGTELQIDKPLPPPVVAKKPKPKPKKKVVKVVKKAPPKKRKKPLTRLQKLRLAAKKRAEAEAAGGSE